MGIIAGLASALLFGLSNLYIRRGQSQSGDLGMFGTTLGNSVIIWTFLLLLGLAGAWSGTGFVAGMTGGAGLVPEGLAIFVLAGLMTTFIGRHLMLEAMRRIGPSRAVSVRCLAPLFTTVAAIVVLGDAFVPLQGLGTAVAVTGLFILGGETTRTATRAQASALRQSATATPPSAGASLAVTSETPATAGLPSNKPALIGDRKTVGAGIVFAMGSAAAYGLGYIARKAGLGYIPSPALGASIGATVAFIGSAMILFVGERARGRSLRQAIPAALSPSLVTGAVLTSSGMVVGFFSFHLAAATVAAVFSSMEPIFTLAFSRIILKQQESISTTAVLGVLISVAGAAIVLAA